MKVKINRDDLIRHLMDCEVHSEMFKIGLAKGMRVHFEDTFILEVTPIDEEDSSELRPEFIKKIQKAPTSIAPKFVNGKFEICEDEIYNNAFGKGKVVGEKVGFLEGLKRHTWMKDGITYVGNGTYTLQEAVKRARKDGFL